MNAMLMAYLLALEKQAGIGSMLGGIAKGIGRVGASIPFYWAGSAIGEKFMKKEPETQQVFVPQERFHRMQLLQRRLAGGPAAGTGNPKGLEVQS